jgi:hypothetical protein
LVSLKGGECALKQSPQNWPRRLSPKRRRVCCLADEPGWTGMCPPSRHRRESPTAGWYPAAIYPFIFCHRSPVASKQVLTRCRDEPYSMERRFSAYNSALFMSRVACKKVQSTVLWNKTPTSQNAFSKVSMHGIMCVFCTHMAVVVTCHTSLTGVWGSKMGTLLPCERLGRAASMRFWMPLNSTSSGLLPTTSGS